MFELSWIGKLRSIRECVTLSFSFHETEFSGLYIIEPHRFPDQRGMYQKNYEKHVFTEHGIDCVFTESSDLYSVKGALRGLHYQTEAPQAKLIHVISGALFDVALDLRPFSPTFGQYKAVLLDQENDILEFIPAGFAHGFIALSDNTVFSYQCSGRYIPDKCGGIRWNDPGLAIPWPLDAYGIDHIIATNKDMHWPTFDEYKKKMGII